MSIRLRLTLWYLTLLATVLLIFSTLYYGILRLSLDAEINRSLHARAEQVVRNLSNTRLSVEFVGQLSRSEVASALVAALDISTTPGSFAQVSWADGSSFMKSQNLRDSDLPFPPKDIYESVINGQPTTFDAQLDQDKIRIYNVSLPTSDDVFLIQTAQSLANVELTLERVLFSLIAGTVLTLIIAALLGTIMAHISLSPIDRITTTAKKIVSAEDLDQRLPVTGTGDELDRLSQTINSMLARLDNLFQAQSRLSADVSHELRTPLTIIRGNVDLLRSCEDEPFEERTETLNAIDSAMDRMARIVSDLLLLSQADAGLSLTMRPVELELLVLDVFHEAHALSNGVGLKLGHTEPAAAFGDEDRLKQLLINLMHNAIKHTPNGGCVTLSLYQEDNIARVNVADTGSGITAEDLPHIFDRFYRAKGQTRRGSGLGLAIAKWIANAHSGTLDVESRVGTGSTFILRLPLEVDEPESEQPEAKSLRAMLRTN